MQADTNGMKKYIAIGIGNKNTRKTSLWMSMGDICTCPYAEDHIYSCTVFHKCAIRFGNHRSVCDSIERACLERVVDIVVDVVVAQCSQTYIRVRMGDMYCIFPYAIIRNAIIIIIINSSSSGDEQLYAEHLYPIASQNAKKSIRHGKVVTKRSKSFSFLAICRTTLHMYISYCIYLYLVYILLGCLHSIYAVVMLYHSENAIIS